jgi:uncharacterized protein
VVGWAWRASKDVDPRLKGRSKFLAAAARERGLTRRLMQIDPASPLGALISEWPQTVGNMVWPYQCAAWDAQTRFARIEGHLHALERLPGLKLAPDEKLVLADLSALSPGLSLVIDRPLWLSREGHLTLSLFKDTFRAFTLSFSLLDRDGLEIFIGGLQGRQDNDILSLYRDLTKELNGVRPRDFMLEALRMFAVSIGARHIYAVADSCKITRHPYFGKKGAAGLAYDEVWQERGGARVEDTHFELPLAGSRRDLEEIAPKKRSMYRRRYQMFDDIMNSLPSDLVRAERRRFAAQ